MTTRPIHEPEDRMTTRHFELHAAVPRAPTLIASPVSLVVTKGRAAAVASVALLEGVTEAEAAEMLDRALLAPVPPPETQAQRDAEKLAAEHARLNAWLRDSKIPVRPEVAATIVRGTCARTDATRAAASWMRDSQRRTLVLLGPMGIGKTIAAALVGVAFARRRQSVGYLREPMLMRLAHSSTLAHEAKLERLRDVDLLIVDELGTTLSGQGERARDAVFGMIDDRISGGRTILIGNLTPEDLGKTYGARFLDRLREVGVVEHLEGESMRGRAT